MDDLIGRRTAQRLFARALTYQEHVGRYKWVTAEMKQWIADFIEDLPSAQTERKRGKWTKISPAGIYECSVCGQNVMTGDIDVYRYCHGCGADMREVDE